MGGPCVSMHIYAIRAYTVIGYINIWIGAYIRLTHRNMLVLLYKMLCQILLYTWVPFFSCFQCSISYRMRCYRSIAFLSVRHLQRQVLLIYNNNNNNIKCLTSFLTTNSNTTRIYRLRRISCSRHCSVLPLCVYKSGIRWSYGYYYASR